MLNSELDSLHGYFPECITLLKVYCQVRKNSGLVYFFYYSRATSAVWLGLFVHHFGSNWNISTTIRQIVLNFCAGIETRWSLMVLIFYDEKSTPTDFCGHLNFYVVHWSVVSKLRISRNQSTFSLLDWHIW